MIKVNNLCKSYDKHSRVLHGVSFELPDTGFVCIVGPSGCGKTSLLNAVSGLDCFDSGKISTDTLKDLRCGAKNTENERNKSFGYIFQNYYLLPEHSVAYNVYLGLHSLALSHKEKCRRVMEALRDVNMANFAQRKVGELSGGQQQRVSIARAIAKRPRVIFADEPTGSLDRANTVNICQLLRKISRSALVVMVTHETEIARFFADRILTVEDGNLISDTDDWQRDGLSTAGDGIYAGDYSEDISESQGITLRMLCSSDAPEVNLTVVALKDQIIIKLDDPRTVLCGTSEESPVLNEGVRPVLRLEDIEHDADSCTPPPCPQTWAGKGVSFSMMLHEARTFSKEKGLRSVGTWLFLVTLTVLTLLTIGDYLNISTLNPEDFVTTDSHILEIQVERGKNTDVNILGVQQLTAMCVEYLEQSELKMDFLPHVPVSAEYSSEIFLQTGNQSAPFYGFSYVPLEYFDEDTLILGRMPESPQEIVIDRWVLDAMLRQDGIIQSGIPDFSYFLNRQITYSKKNYSPTIVGICDSGEPALYLSKADLVNIGVSSSSVIRLSDLKKLVPEKYDSVSLMTGECIIVLNNAGYGYSTKIGASQRMSSGVILDIADAVEEPATHASFVVADLDINTLTRSMLQSRFYIYCEDKEAVKSYISKGLPEEYKGQFQLTVADRSTQAWDEYRSAANLQLDGRNIVIITVLLVSLVMLYLLGRAKIRERMDTVTVYRLLGIPGQKLAGIFVLESCLLFLKSTLPAAVITWLTVFILRQMPSLNISVLLPWQAALIITAALLILHALLSVIPLIKLLRLPPAQLASKYDI